MGDNFPQTSIDAIANETDIYPSARRLYFYFPTTILYNKAPVSRKTPWFERTVLLLTLQFPISTPPCPTQDKIQLRLEVIHKLCKANKSKSHFNYKFQKAFKSTLKIYLLQHHINNKSE